MAINFPTTPRYSQEEVGGMPDLQQALMQGLQNYMQMQMQPRQMAEQLLSQQLQNKMQGIKAQYAEPTARANLELIEARKARAMQPSAPRATAPAARGMSSFGKAMSDAERIGQQYGTDSEEYKLAQGYAKKLAMGLSPKTERMPAAARTERQPKLSVQEQKALAGAKVMDYLTPIIQENPYIGAAPTKEIVRDQYLYKFGSPQEKQQAKDRLKKFAVASGLIAEHTSGALLGQRITATVPALEHQRKSQTIGWPTAFEKQASLIPSDIQKEAKKEIAGHMQKLKATSGTPKQKSMQTEDPLGILSPEEKKQLGVL